MGRLPDVQVPTKVQEARFHQVSYRDHSVSFSFTIVPCPDEPARLKATVVGKAFTGSIKNVLDVNKEETLTEVLEECRIPVSQSSSVSFADYFFLLFKT
ncbi:PREDICTED: structural maintenance of chromosomes flexible hinge domain-containing protein 1-like [Poecilia mexicana]|uniref:structural maintenance of chromosomes flexible hinge domain-containing protein 1-like n=1 Tax=Poecilia mexicana TaxID=48701 RepID=UPI00072EB2D5|nr:PREDICTED: structural maintenance of chromosomes flexible hinge domain-containing protein 1-like [Poecilia mexicana]